MRILKLTKTNILKGGLLTAVAGAGILLMAWSTNNLVKQYDNEQGQLTKIQNEEFDKFVDSKNINDVSDNIKPQKNLKQLLDSTKKFVIDSLTTAMKSDDLTVNTKSHLKK
jgi:hypothetical protein